MTNRILNTVPIKIIAAILMILLAVFCLIVLLNPSAWIITVLCFLIAAGLVMFFFVHFEWRMKEAVTVFSKEVSDLTVNLSEKNYSGATAETRMFFDALTQTKQALDKKSRNRQELLDIVNSVASHMEITKLLRDLLPKLNEATRSTCSAFYSINQSTSKLEIKHSVGFSKNVYGEFDMNLGEGLIGQAANKREITFYRDIPDDTVYFIRTFIGKLKPRSLMVVPIISQDVTTGVLVCASIYDYSPEDMDMIELIRHYVGVAVSNSANFERTKRLTNELTFQNKLFQEQHVQMKTLLDEKSEWLNSLLRFSGDDTACALDAKGAIVLWGALAERVYNISGRNAIGKSFGKICEDTGWPSVSNALQEAMRAGNHSEHFRSRPMPGKEVQREIEMELRRVCDERNEPLGVVISVRLK